jgi:hypothetical protein
MGEENIGGASGANTPGAGTEGNKVTFTPEQQEYVNKIVATRVNETKAGFAKAQEDSTILQNMFKDPEFIAWVNGDRSQPMPGGNGNKDPMEELMDKDTLTGKDVVTLIQQLMGKEMQPIKAGLDNVTRTTQTLGVDHSLQRLASQVDGKTGEPAFPHLWDQEFRGEVMALLGKRAATPEDAYYLAQRDREISGKGIPQTAYLLDSSGGAGGRIRGGLGGGREEKPETLDSLGVKANKQGKVGIRDIVRGLIDKQGG